MKDIKTHHLPSIMDCCPWCGGGPLTAATNAVLGEDEAPKPGDTSVCIYCAQPLEFTQTGLKRLTEAEIQKFSLLEREELRRAMAAARQMPTFLRTPRIRREI